MNTRGQAAHEGIPAAARRKRARRAQARLHSLLTALILLACLLIGSFEIARNAVAAPSSAPQSVDKLDDGTPLRNAPVTQGPSAGSRPSSPDDGLKLLLVNPWNPLPENHKVKLTTLKNGHAVDERCYNSLQKMMDDCRAQGLSPLICSSYRSQQKQEQLYQNQVDRFTAQGYTLPDAQAEAGKVVAVPGTSEHQLGLAVDIVDVANQNLDESQEKTAVQIWLMENSWKYGFILRYPNNKSAITGIIYEPWHYRYVGEEAAAEIFSRDICLEEYL